MFLDNRDREVFLKTLGEACEKTGWRIHAYVLMPNHYHLLVETPEANLVKGMSWLQGTFTIRFNTRHKMTGHLFGGRYKAILVESGPAGYFRNLIDYIHLNPVRAGLVSKGVPIEQFKWSSINYYRMSPANRERWQIAADGLESAGCRDSPGGRRQYLIELDKRIPWDSSRDAGLVGIEGQSMNSTLKRGWFFGSQAFKEVLMKKAADFLGGKEGNENYHGFEMVDHSEQVAEEIVAKGMRELGLTTADLKNLKKNDWRKAIIAFAARKNTVVPLAWLSARLEMGTVAGVSRSVREISGRLDYDRKVQQVLVRIA